MIASINTHGCQTITARRKFIAYTLIRFVVGMAIGTLIALAENADWLPSRLSQWTMPSSLRSPILLSMMGPLLLQTVAAPLLSIAGLYPMGYPYASRIIYSLFWVMRGVDAWMFLQRLSEHSWQPWLALILMVAIIFFVGAVMLRVHLLATTGVYVRVLNRDCGLPPTAYFRASVRLWGALILWQLAFDLLYISIL